MHLEQIHSQINNAYVDGISITLGSPCKHVWAYTVSHSDSINAGQSNCSCAPVPGASPPAFVKEDYYYESGASGGTGPYFYISDPLWDGKVAQLVMDVVYKWECQCSIEKHSSHPVRILECVYAKMNHTMIKIRYSH